MINIFTTTVPPITITPPQKKADVSSFVAALISLLLIFLILFSIYRIIRNIFTAIKSRKIKRSNLIGAIWPISLTFLIWLLVTFIAQFFGHDFSNIRVNKWVCGQSSTPNMTLNEYFSSHKGQNSAFTDVQPITKFNNIVINKAQDSTSKIEFNLENNGFRNIEINDVSLYVSIENNWYYLPLGEECGCDNKSRFGIPRNISAKSNLYFSLKTSFFRFCLSKLPDGTSLPSRSTFTGILPNGDYAMIIKATHPVIWKWKVERSYAYYFEIQR